MEDTKKSTGFTHIKLTKKDGEKKLEFRCMEVLDLEEGRDYYLLGTEYKFKKEGKPFFFKKSEGKYELITKDAPDVIFEKELKGTSIWKNPLLRRKGNE